MCGAKPTPKIDLWHALGRWIRFGTVGYCLPGWMHCGSSGASSLKRTFQLALKEFETTLANAPGRHGAVQGAAHAAELYGQK